eukprot:jgi/Mesvir1/8712/Mv02644-RA.1
MLRALWGAAFLTGRATCKPLKFSVVEPVACSLMSKCGMVLGHDLSSQDKSGCCTFGQRTFSTSRNTPETTSGRESARPFAEVGSGELIRDYVYQSILTLPQWIVEYGLWTTQRMLESQYRGIAIAALRATSFRHFCAGSDAAEATETLQRLKQLGLRGILDYSVEDASDDRACDANLETLLGALDYALAHAPADSITHVCLKMSSLTPDGLLERISECLWYHHHNRVNAATDASTSDYGKASTAREDASGAASGAASALETPQPGPAGQGNGHSWREGAELPVLVDSSIMPYADVPPRPSLSGEDEAALLRCLERLRAVCLDVAARRQAGHSELQVMVDAEDASIQPAIDHLAHRLMAEFNQGGVCVVNTVQAYRKDSVALLAAIQKALPKTGIQYGLKLVRGAYLEKERALAAAQNRDCIIHDNIGATHAGYNKCAGMALTSVVAATPDTSVGRVASLVLATHNEASCVTIATKALELGLQPTDRRLQFSQLKGMADSLSLGLVKRGFQVSKYLPFGPVDVVVPYLLRRLDENKGMLSGARSERKKIWAEMMSRMGWKKDKASA